MTRGRGGSGAEVSVNPPSPGSTLFAIPFASFGCITQRKSHLVKFLG